MIIVACRAHNLPTPPLIASQTKGLNQKHDGALATPPPTLPCARSCHCGLGPRSSNDRDDGRTSLNSASELSLPARRHVLGTLPDGRPQGRLVAVAVDTTAGTAHLILEPPLSTGN
jgi:hypothetical protein